MGLALEAWMLEPYWTFGCTPALWSAFAWMEPAWAQFLRLGPSTSATVVSFVAATGMQAVSPKAKPPSSARSPTPFPTQPRMKHWFNRLMDVFLILVSAFLVWLLVVWSQRLPHFVWDFADANGLTPWEQELQHRHRWREYRQLRWRLRERQGQAPQHKPWDASWDSGI